MSWLLLRLDDLRDLHPCIPSDLHGEPRTVRAMRVSSSVRSGGLSTGHANCRTCDEGPNSRSNALYAGIDRGKLFGLA
jgi:hypothetical protein